MDTESQPIFPHVSQEMYALVQALCEGQGCTHSDVVEGALLAYLAPRAPTDRDTLLFQKLAHLEQDVQALAPLLEQILGYLLAKTPAQKPTVASYEQLYPTLLDEADDEPIDVDEPSDAGAKEQPLSRWQRFLSRKWAQ